MAMEYPAETAAYRLVVDEARRELLAAAEIDGFFVDPSREAPSRVLLVGTTYDRPFDRAGDFSGPAVFQEVELQVRDVNGRAIGTYFIGEVHVTEVRKNDLTGTDVEVDFRGLTCPFQYAGEIWHRWRSGRPRTKGEWAKNPVEWHESWLHVVQTAWFEGGHQATRYHLTNNYTIDGADVVSLASFYCALGEAINGPGGYFGSSLDALADCLRLATATGPPFRLIWRNVGVFEETLGGSELDAIVATFRYFSSHDRPGYVTLTLDR